MGSPVCGVIDRNDGRGRARGRSRCAEPRGKREGLCRVSSAVSAVARGVAGFARTSWHISSLKSTCRRHPSGADPASAASRYSATWSRFFGPTAALPRG